MAEMITEKITNSFEYKLSDGNYGSRGFSQMFEHTIVYEYGEERTTRREKVKRWYKEDLKNFTELRNDYFAQMGIEISE